MRTQNPELLYLLFIIPLIILAFILYTKWKNKAITKFGELYLLKQLMPLYSPNRIIFKNILIWSSIATLIFALINPQIGSKTKKVKRKGADIIIALDISNSMLAEDIAPSRLENAKQAINKLLNKLDNDRIGLIVFAGKAFVQLPITQDYDAALMFINTVNTNIIKTQGTAIGAAINLASMSFPKDNMKNKAIIIISDGENHEDDALEAAKTATSQGITIHTIGIGSPNGAPVPIYDRGIMLGYRKDKEGNTVMSKLNEEMLSDIAKQGNGIYVKANYNDFGLNTIYNELEKLEKKETESTIYSDYEDRFIIFLWISLVLLVIEFMLSENKSLFVQKFKLFRKENLFESFLFKNKTNH